MKDSDTGELFTIIGIAVARLLKPGISLAHSDIIDAIHAMSRASDNPSFTRACREAIKVIARKMH